MVLRDTFHNISSGLEGVRYNVTLSYAIGDLATLSVVTSGLSGIGVEASVTEVRGASRPSRLGSDHASKWRRPGTIPSVSRAIQALAAASKENPHE